MQSRKESAEADKYAAKPVVPQLSPALALSQMIFGTWISQSIYVAASLGIADLLVEGPKDVETLAQATGALPPKLYRVLRTLASVGIFKEVAPRRFELTEMAEYLRSDLQGSLRGVSMMLSDDWHWNSWGDILNVVKTGVPAMKHLYGVDSTFEYLAKHPRSQQTYNHAMSGWSTNIHTAVVGAYDFSGTRSIVDVAGGYGSLITAILATNPNIRGALFDQPHVVPGARARMERENLADRCECVGGDMFQSIPANHDTYIMSHILHDWSDDDCVQILKNVRRGITGDGKLLVVEMVVPEGNVFDFAKWMDIDVMIMYSNGRERTEAEFAELYRAAGFRLSRVVPTASPVSVVEGVCI